VGASLKTPQYSIIVLDEIDPQALQRWLEKSKLIQWDYKNIAKRKGKL
jgi:hypothetical protein